MVMLYFLHQKTGQNGSALRADVVREAEPWETLARSARLAFPTGSLYLTISTKLGSQRSCVWKKFCKIKVLKDLRGVTKCIIRN